MCSSRQLYEWQDRLKWEYNELAGKNGMWWKCMCKLFSVASTELSAVVGSLPRKFCPYNLLYFSSNFKQCKLLVRFTSAASGLSPRSSQKPVSHQCRDVWVYKQSKYFRIFLQWNMHDENIRKSGHKGCFWIWKMFSMDKFFCWINFMIFKLCISFGNEWMVVTWGKQWI